MHCRLKAASQEGIGLSVVECVSLHGADRHLDANQPNRAPAGQDIASNPNRNSRANRLSSPQIQGLDAKLFGLPIQACRETTVRDYQTPAARGRPTLDLAGVSPTNSQLSESAAHYLSTHSLRGLRRTERGSYQSQIASRLQRPCHAVTEGGDC